MAVVQCFHLFTVSPTNFSFSAVFLDLNYVVLCFRYYISQIHNGYIFQLIKKKQKKHLSGRNTIRNWVVHQIKRDRCLFWSRLKFCHTFLADYGSCMGTNSNNIDDKIFFREPIRTFILTREPLIVSQADSMWKGIWN